MCTNCTPTQGVVQCIQREGCPKGGAHHELKCLWKTFLGEMKCEPNGKD